MNVREFEKREFEMLRCPVCGGTDLVTKQEARAINPFGVGETTVMETVDCCCACGEEGDFAGVNDPIIDKAIDTAITLRALESLDRLKAIRITPVYIDRCFGLHIGTVADWARQKKFPREGYALLRLIERQPALIEVAKNGYPPPYTLCPRDLENLPIDKIRMYANYSFSLQEGGNEYAIEKDDTAYRIGCKIYPEHMTDIMINYPSIKALQEHWK